MMADHDRLLAGNGRKRWKPATLLIHADVRANHIFLPLRIQQKLQRMKRPVSVP